MNTIANRKALKSRISKGWSHDSNHYRFAMTHNSRAPFISERDRLTFGDLAGAIAAVVLFGVVLLLGGL